MSKSLLDLLNKTRGDIASKRGNNIDLTRLKDGNNYLRIFPNKDDPNGVFFQTFGMHYVKHQNEEGKDVTTAYICEQHTHGHACQLCEMVMEGRARFKGNKAMEERINSMRATPRYLVNGVLSAREDFADAEKCQLIELPSTVFDDICKVMSEDIADDIGNPLSKEEGYAFLIKRTGSGRDTKYDVSPKRKVYKGDIPEKLWTTKIGVMFGDPTTSPGGDSPKFYASVRIRLGASVMKDGKEKIGQDVGAECIKNKVAPPFGKCSWKFYFDPTRGLDVVESLVEYMLEEGYLPKSASGRVEIGEKKYTKSQIVEMYREKPLAEIIAALQAIDDRREKTSPTDELED